MSYNHPTQDDDPTGGQATSGSEPAPGQAPSRDESNGFPHHSGEWDYEPGDPSLASTGVTTADQPHPPPAGQHEQASPRAQDGAEAPKSRTSLAQWAANRRNAQHSTGPRSEKGKRASSLNGMTHGLRHPDDRGSVGFSGVHDRTNVVHALRERWEPERPIRQSRPALVEGDGPGERTEPGQGPGDIRQLHSDLDMTDEARHEHDIARAITNHLVPDREIAAPGIQSLRKAAHDTTGHRP